MKTKVPLVFFLGLFMLPILLFCGKIWADIFNLPNLEIFQLSGHAEGAYFGRSVAAAGDVNADDGCGNNNKRPDGAGDPPGF